MKVRKQLIEWLKEIVPHSGNLGYYIKETPSKHFDMGLLLFTDTHIYHISAKKGYLGCTSSTRKHRAGEDWTRGGDLPDGKFNRKTWEAIKNAILRYEIVKREDGAESIVEEEPKRGAS